MKKMTLLITMMLLGIFVSAQVTITGKVTDASSGEPLPGVSVSVKDFKSAGALTNEQGVYSLALPEGGKTLIFSFFGMQTKEVEIGGQTEINVGMEAADIVVDDVIITALGITRNERSLGYAVQDITANDLAVKDPLSLTNSLQGRVSGVQIKTGSGTVGGSSSVIIRGASSLGGSNQPLYVVDGTPISNFSYGNTTGGYDFGNGAQDINPDDVENISILKGASATTLYGNRGANGVILITTKSGKKKNGLGIEINSTTTFDQAYIFPKFQNEYGGGGALTFPTFNYALASTRGIGPEWASFNGLPVSDTGIDESWGPKLEGQEVLQWDSFVPESENYMKSTPWIARPDNYKNFFDTGITLSNSVSINGGGDKSIFRVGYTNVSQKGLIPNSELKKNLISFKGSVKLNDKIEVFTNFNYINQSTKGLSQFGYFEEGQNVAGALRIWTQRQVDVNALRKHYYSDVLGQQVGWNFRSIADGRVYLRYSNNPFWSLENIYANTKKDRIYGNAGFKINIIEGLYFTATARTDYYTLLTDDRIGTGGITTDYYGQSNQIGYENNFEGIFNYTKRFADNWSLDAVFGGNIMYQQANSNYIETVGGLIIENFFNVSNSVLPPNSGSTFSERQTNSIFGSASLGYKNMFYLDLTGRNDWSSTLPVNANSYFYPSVSGSFIFSELLSNQSLLSFGKIRAGYALVGSDTWAYRLYDSYAISSFGSATTFTVGNQRNNPNLKNETTAEFEAGLELAFLNRRVGAEFSYFDRKSFDQIIGLSVSSTTGYSSAVINSGELQNKGFEAVLYGTPIKTDDFSWNITMNYSSYDSKLNSLYGDIADYRIIGTSRIWVSAVVGGDYGMMNAVTTYARHENGRKLVNSTTGRYISSGTPKELGSILPDYNGGIMNSFTYKGFNFSALIDFQKGGLVYSTANEWATKAGQTDITVGLNDKGNPVRLPVAEGGGIRCDGVYADGTENTIYIEARTYFSDFRAYAEEFTYDASYIKLRELKLGYSLPNSLVSKIKLQSATISIVARNVALLHSNAYGFDPEQVNSIANGSQAIEGGSLPSSRSIGFNINLKF